MVSGISSSFNTASLSELRQQMFNKIDTNSDGSIDRTEMNALIQQGASQGTSDLVDAIFSSQDSDQDGLISLIESNSSLAKLDQEMKGGGAGMSPAGGPPPPPEKVFATADTNEDGVVSQDELAAVIGQGGGDIGELFGKVDADGDGVISRTEDDAWLAQMAGGQAQQGTALAGNTGSASGGIFAQADADGDGSVSEAELSAVIGKDVSSLFGKIDTDGDGLISRTEDAAWLETKGGKTEQASTGISASETGTVSSSGGDWRNRMFFSLLKSFVAASGASTSSVSLYT